MFGQIHHDGIAQKITTFFRYGLTELVTDALKNLEVKRLNTQSGGSLESFTVLLLRLQVKFLIWHEIHNFYNMSDDFL